jgi:putative oxidoreductase
MKFIINLHYQLGQLLNYLQSPALLAARLYVAWVFFAAGLTKIKDWDNTLLLFQYEYQVPIIPPELAAYMGTAGEIILPILLVFGLFGRLAGIGISLVNIVAVLSLSDIPPAAYNLHLVWGAVALPIIFWGSGRLSLDAFLEKRYY